MTELIWRNARDCWQCDCESGGHRHFLHKLAPERRLRQTGTHPVDADGRLLIETMWARTEHIRPAATGSRMPCAADQPTVRRLPERGLPGRTPWKGRLPGKGNRRSRVSASRIVPEIRQSVHETIREETCQPDRIKSGNYTVHRGRQPPVAQVPFLVQRQRATVAGLNPRAAGRCLGRRVGAGQSRLNHVARI